MENVDPLDTLFVVQAFSNPIVLIIHFAVRKHYLICFCSFVCYQYNIEYNLPLIDDWMNNQSGPFKELK